MNLLMISGDRTLASGRRGAFYNTLEELHAHFDRIDVVCPRGSVQRYDMVVFGNVYVHPSPLPLIMQPLWIWYRGVALIRAHRHALMTVHEYAPFYNGWGAKLLAWSTQIPYLLEIFHVPGVPKASGIRERIYRWLTRLCIAWDARTARAVRVMSRRGIPSFLERAGVPTQKIHCIPAIYIDRTVFHPEETPKQYDVAFVGRLASNKGIDVFLDVVERLGSVAVVVGDGPLLSWVRRQVRRRGLKVHVAGFVADAGEVASYMRASRVLLMPSLNEGGPRVVIEALACGTPVVATPVGIVEDVLPPECIEEWNASDIADKVRNILADVTLYERLRQQGIAVASSYDRSTVIAHVARDFQRLSA